MWTAEMFLALVLMKLRYPPSLSWNLCRRGLWELLKDLPRAYRRTCRDNQAPHSIHQITPQLIWKRQHMLSAKKVEYLLLPRMWYFSLAQDNTHFHLNTNSLGLLWVLSSMKVRRALIQAQDNMITLDKLWDRNLHHIQWVAVHQDTLVPHLPDLDLQAPELIKLVVRRL